MATNPKSTVALIEAAMQDSDRSMKWTAERSGIATATFRRKIRGGADFTVSEVARIGKALGIHPADLLPAEFRTAVAA